MTDSERPRAAIDSHIARTLPPWRLPERKRMEPFSYPILRRHELAQGGFGPWSSLRRSSVGATAADAADEARNAIGQVDEAGKYPSERQRQAAAPADIPDGRGIFDRRCGELRRSRRGGSRTSRAWALRPSPIWKSNTKNSARTACCVDTGTSSRRPPTPRIQPQDPIRLFSDRPQACRPLCPGLCNVTLKRTLLRSASHAILPP